MNYEKILHGVLSKTLNVDDGKFAELIKNGESELSESEIISQLLKLDVDRVKAIKDETGKEKFQEGFKKSKKEVLEALETEMKEKFNIESSKTGLDLVNEIVEKTSKPNSEVTEDAIRRSKLFLDLESKLKSEIKELKTQHQNEVDTIKKSYEGEKILSSVNANAMKILNELNPILPSNATIAENQKKAFLNQFKDFGFEIQDDRIVVLDKDGKVLQDEHGNTKTFDEIVKAKASNFFELAQNNGGSGSGNGGQNGEGSSGGNSGVQTPKTLEELTNIMNDDSIDGAEKLKIAEAYEKQNS